AADSSEDLREKADLLKDTEDQIERELAVLDKRYASAQRRNALERSISSLESNPFAEDVRRQRAPSGGSTSRTGPTAGFGNQGPSPSPGVQPPPTTTGDPLQTDRSGAD